MCGICGFTATDPEKIERMTASLAHRGPDARRTATVDSVSLGHARLAILDPTDAGLQPMWSRSKETAIVFNGEIYNFRELADRYRLDCRTRTDTEVLLLLYEKLGIDFVNELRGMFAFALYDKTDQTLRLVRDPSGIKPLYYSVTDGVLYFASETKAILTALPAKPDINTKTLSLYCRHGYVPAPHTLLQKVYSMVPGEILTWKSQKLQSGQCRMPVVELPYTTNRADAVSALPDILQESVTAHLVADKPLGLFLSGGLDSSVCLYHMQQSGMSDVKTFTVRFDVAADEDPTKFNSDADSAAQTARLYDADHSELLISATDARDAYAHTAYALDQPNANPTAVIQYLLSRYAKQSVDVALSGIGGDELFGGYSRYRIAALLSAMRQLPAPLRRIAAQLLRQPVDVWTSDTLAALAERLMTMRPAKLSPLLKDDWYDGTTITSYIEAKTAPVAELPFAHGFMEYDRLGWLVDEALRLTDGTMMASGLEGRTPFIDRSVITFAQSINPRAHFSGRQMKQLIRQAYKDKLPAHVLNMKKRGFFSPMAKWLRRECAVLIDEAIESPFLAQYFDAAAMQATAEKHASHEVYAMQELMMLVQLHFWWKTVYDPA